eukprot:764733-Hanusia_phi.AAC.2
MRGWGSRGGAEELMRGWEQKESRGVDEGMGAEGQRAQGLLVLEGAEVIREAQGGEERRGCRSPTRRNSTNNRRAYRPDSVLAVSLEAAICKIAHVSTPSLQNHPPGS